MDRANSSAAGKNRPLPGATYSTCSTCLNAIDVRSCRYLDLYDLGPYRALEIPRKQFLAHGSADPVADAATKPVHAALPQFFTRPVGGQYLIEGELITLPDAGRDLLPTVGWKVSGEMPVRFMAYFGKCRFGRRSFILDLRLEEF